MEKLAKKAYRLYILELVFSTNENLINMDFITYEQFKRMYEYHNIQK